MLNMEDDLDDLYNYKIIERPDDNTWLFYVETKVALFFMTSRELVCKLTRTQLNPNQILLRSFSTTHPQYPLRKDKIRSEWISYALFE